MNDIEKYNQLSKYALHESSTMKAAIEMAQSFALKESASMKAVREMKQSFALKESATMKAAIEMAQSFALKESASMKAAIEMTQSFALKESASMKAAIEMAQSFELKESASMKAAREMTQSFALKESASMKAAREMTQSFALKESATVKTAIDMAQSFGLRESATMKAARDMAQSFAMKESASMKAAREIIQSFALKEPTAIKAVREMSELFKQRNSFAHIDDFDTLEEVVVGLGEASSPRNIISPMEWYDNQTPSVQLIIGLVLAYWINIFSSLSMPLYDDWTYLFEKESTRVASKLVIKAASNEYDVSELASYRFIDASILHVRANPSINADIIDEIVNGKVVKFIIKSKRWVQIEFICEDTGEHKVGWVFSRYLRKFER
jgi:hypothetical protein